MPLMSVRLRPSVEASSPSGSEAQESEHLAAPVPVDRPVVFFDGVCKLCNWTVRFIINRDPTKAFLFAPLQSEFARERLLPFTIDTSSVEALVLLDGDRCFERSAAALQIARQLRAPWPMLAIFLLVPSPIRDFVYLWIARNRYRWFGREEYCRIPSPPESGRFLANGPEHSGQS